MDQELRYLMDVPDYVAKAKEVMLEMRDGTPDRVLVHHFFNEAKIAANLFNKDGKPSWTVIKAEDVNGNFRYFKVDGLYTSPGVVLISYVEEVGVDHYLDSLNHIRELIKNYNEKKKSAGDEDGDFFIDEMS